MQDKCRQDFLYSQNGIVVRKSVKSDLDALKDNLRQSDVVEIKASHGVTPEQALTRGLEKSIWSCTIENGRPIGVFGLNPESIMGYKAVVWFLATDDLDKIQRRFLRHGRYFVNMMLDFYPFLENHVHSENKKAINWLKWLGANIGQPEPLGINGEMFHHFYFDRKNWSK
jgi:hypothetical protein